MCDILTTTLFTRCNLSRLQKARDMILASGVKSEGFFLHWRQFFLQIDSSTHSLYPQNFHVGLIQRTQITNINELVFLKNPRENPELSSGITKTEKSVHLIIITE